MVNFFRRKKKLLSSSSSQPTTNITTTSTISTTTTILSPIKSSSSSTLTPPKNYRNELFTPIFFKVFKNKILINHVLSYIPKIHKELDLKAFKYDMLDVASWICRFKYFSLLKDKLNHASHNYFIFSGFNSFVSFCTFNEDLDLFKYVYTTNKDEFNRLGCMDFCSGSPNVEIIKYLHQEGVKCTTLAMDNACANGRLEAVQFLHTHRTEGCTINSFNNAVREGFLEIVQFLHENRTEGGSDDAMDLVLFRDSLEIEDTLLVPNDTEDDLSMASTTAVADGEEYVDPVYFVDEELERKRLDMIIYLNENRTRERCTTTLFDNAAKCGYLSIIKYLFKNRTEGCSQSAIDNASTYGHHSVVQFLHNNSTQGCTPKAMDGAAKKGQYQMIKYINQHLKIGCSSDAMDFAAGMGRFDIVKYLHENGHHCSQHAMEAAIRIGRADIVQFLLNNRPERCGLDALESGVTSVDVLKILRAVPDLSHLFTKAAMDSVAAIGSLASVTFLHDTRTEPNCCTAAAIDEASANGHLSVVSFLNEKGYECTVASIEGAARNGHLECVKYLHQKRRECSSRNAPNAIYMACKGCDSPNNNQKEIQLQIVRYLLENGYECSTNAMDEAAKHGAMSIVYYLHENGKSCTTAAMDEASRNGHVNIVHFLHYNRTEGATTAAMDLASYNGQIEIVKFLHYNRTEGCTKLAMDGAACSGKLNIVEFLNNNREEGCTQSAFKFSKSRKFRNILKYLEEHQSHNASTPPSPWTSTMNNTNNE